jgi:mediator of RNA polymerase II transcription subunit 25
MNQPTWEDFQRLESELREEMRKLREQITEPIHVTRGVDLERRLDDHNELLKEMSQKQDKFIADVEELKIDAKAYTGDAAIFKNKVERIESDMSTLKTDANTLKTDMSTLKSDAEQVKTVQSGHSKFFEEHGKRLAATATKDDVTRLETAMATKGDLAAMKNEILDAMKQLLQQKSGE